MTPTTYKLIEFRPLELPNGTNRGFFIKGEPKMNNELDTILFQADKRIGRIRFTTVIFLNNVELENRLEELYKEGKFTSFQGVSQDIPTPAHYRRYGKNGDSTGNNAGEYIVNPQTGERVIFSSIRVSTLFVNNQPNEDLEAKAKRIFNNDLRNGIAEIANHETYEEVEKPTTATLTAEQMQIKRAEIEAELKTFGHTLLTSGLEQPSVTAAVEKKRVELLTQAGLI